MSSEAANKNLSEEEAEPQKYSDAIYCDDYGEDFEVGPYRTYEQKMRRLEEFDKQLEDKNYRRQTLEEAHPNVKITTRDKLEQLLQKAEQMKNKESNESEKSLPDDAGKDKLQN